MFSKSGPSVTYFVLKALHIVSVIAWMAGLLYLPRLFVYHTQVPMGSERDRMLQTMEHRLLRIIMNPAMIAAWGLGLWLMMEVRPWSSGWFHAKIALVLGLSWFHGLCARWRRQFVVGHYPHSTRFFRLVNEVPTLLMVGIVFLVVFKRF